MLGACCADDLGYSSYVLLVLQEPEPWRSEAILGQVYSTDGKLSRRHKPLMTLSWGNVPRLVQSSDLTITTSPSNHSHQGLSRSVRYIETPRAANQRPEEVGERMESDGVGYGHFFR